MGRKTQAERLAVLGAVRDTADRQSVTTTYRVAELLKAGELHTGELLRACAALGWVTAATLVDDRYMQAGHSDRPVLRRGWTLTELGRVILEPA